jgi:hypothetical protein
MPGCDWDIAEAAGDVEALVLAYARDHYGELPEPSILGPLRAQRVADAIETHLSGHSPDDEAQWITKIFPTKPSQVRA